MALKAGRVGVAKSEVDEFGHITGGGTPENVYTKSQCDNKFELKSHIGGLKFRDNDGIAQYQLPNGEWTNFSSGGGETLGFNIPEELVVTTGFIVADCVINSGGYYLDSLNNLFYLDVVITPTTGSGNFYIKKNNVGAKPLQSEYYKSMGVLSQDASGDKCVATLANWTDIGFQFSSATAGKSYRIFGIVRMESL